MRQKIHISPRMPTVHVPSACQVTAAVCVSNPECCAAEIIHGPSALVPAAGMWPEVTCAKKIASHLARFFMLPLPRHQTYDRDTAAYSTTKRAPSGCTGRLLGCPINLVNCSICCLDAVIGFFNTSQRTPSLQGGVVKEPAKR